MGNKYYAVKKGRKPGIYDTWDECRKQTLGFSGAVYKSFKTRPEAEAFLTPGEYETMTVDEETLTAYVDGSFHKDDKAFSYGMVIIRPEQGELYFAEKYEDEDLASMRNVAGEIKGSEAAMKFALDHGYKKLAIYYDYEGIRKWCTGEWKTNKEGTRAYKAFYDQKKKDLKVKFVKVKGHSNDKYNDMADMLAKSALGIGDGSFAKTSETQWHKEIIAGRNGNG